MPPRKKAAKKKAAPKKKAAQPKPPPAPPSYDEVVGTLSKTFPTGEWFVMYGNDEIEKACRDLYAGHGEKLLPLLENTIGSAVSYAVLAEIRKALAGG